MNISEKTCVEFVDVLASKAPVPGGGGAAALVGAIGMALGGKGFKPINPFEIEEKKPRETSIKEREDTLNYLKEKFKKFGGGI